MAKVFATAPKALAYRAPGAKTLRGSTASYSGTVGAPPAPSVPPAQGLGGSYISALEAVQAKSPDVALAGENRLANGFEVDRMNGVGGGSVGKGTLTPQANFLAKQAAHVAENFSPYGYNIGGQSPAQLAQQNSKIVNGGTQLSQAALDIQKKWDPALGVDKRNEPLWRQTLDSVAAKQLAGPNHQSQESIAKSMMPYYGDQQAADAAANARAQWGSGGGNGGDGGNGGQAMHDPNVFGPPVNAVQYARGLGGSYVPPTNFNSSQEASGMPPSAPRPELERRPNPAMTVYPGGG